MRVEAPERPAQAVKKNMVWIPGGDFMMGSEEFYPEERPVHRVTVDGFWMDEHPVTVAEYRRFVKATGHVTVAEKALDAALYPDADPDLLVPGSLVFRKTRGPVRLDDYRNWWHWIPGAQWRHPAGPDSGVNGLDRHPVTHVAWDDVTAYAAWAGKKLPTEAEWEFAARGGLQGKTFTWGDEFAPRGKMMANTWQGEFPWQNLNLDKFEGTSPVSSFPANGYGLRHGGQRLGVDVGLLHAQPSRAGRACVLRTRRTAREPARRIARAKLQRGSARWQFPAPRRKGRLASVRAELLPSLSARGSPGADHRNVDGPPRFPLHRQAGELTPA